jgi:hypothetical protein
MPPNDTTYADTEYVSLNGAHEAGPAGTHLSDIPNGTAEAFD